MYSEHSGLYFVIWDNLIQVHSCETSVFFDKQKATAELQLQRKIYEGFYLRKKDKILGND